MLLNTAGEAKASDAAGDHPTHDPVDDQRDDIDGKEQFWPCKFHVAVAPSPAETRVMAWGNTFASVAADACRHSLSSVTSDLRDAHGVPLC